MFSGIVEGTGVVREVVKFGEGLRMTVDVGFGGFRVKRGESVSVNGVCLTAVSVRKKKRGASVIFDISPETLKRTNLGMLKKGDPVNIERALRLSDGVSGHLVQGHILTTLRILSVSKKGEFAKFKFEMKSEIKNYIVEKCFVAIDGISLTVSGVGRNFFSVDIIPETMRRTNLKVRREGDLVNFEPDIIVKTVADLLPDILSKLKM